MPYDPRNPDYDISGSIVNPYPDIAPNPVSNPVVVAPISPTPTAPKGDVGDIADALKAVSTTINNALLATPPAVARPTVSSPRFGVTQADRDQYFGMPARTSVNYGGVTYGGANGYGERNDLLQARPWNPERGFYRSYGSPIVPKSVTAPATTLTREGIIKQYKDTVPGATDDAANAYADSILGPGGGTGVGAYDANYYARQAAGGALSESDAYNLALKAGFQGLQSDFNVLKDAYIHQWNGGGGYGGGGGGAWYGAQPVTNAVGETNGLTLTSRGVTEPGINPFPANDQELVFNESDLSTLPEAYRAMVDRVMRQLGYIPEGFIGQYGERGYRRPAGSPVMRVTPELIQGVTPDATTQAWLNWFFARKGLSSNVYPYPTVTAPANGTPTA